MQFSFKTQLGAVWWFDSTIGFYKSQYCANNQIKQIIMEENYLQLIDYCKDLTVDESFIEVEKFVAELMYLDKTVLDISKRWTDTNTWTSHPYIVKAYFGEKLSAVLKSVLSSKSTNDMNEKFSILDFQEELTMAILKDIPIMKVYHDNMGRLILSNGLSEMKF